MGRPKKIVPVEWCEKLPELSGEIMKQHYARNLDFVIEHMDENVMWIGASECEYTVGKDAMYQLLFLQLNTPCKILESSYHLIYKSDTTATVSGKLTVETCEETGLYLKVKQRVTFQYVKAENDKPVIVHLHVSNIWDILEPNEKFPYRAGRETYLYVLEQLKKKEGLMKKIELAGKKHEKYLLLADEILYIEAQRHYCIVYYMDGRLEVMEAIGTVAKRLPEQFLTVHRSYIVNMNYIVGIERKSLVLCDSLRVPIPTKRYNIIRKQVLQWLEEHDALAQYIK